MIEPSSDRSERTGGRVDLEEERDFLLASIADLDREFAAGDIDETDYLGLKDGYTARAASVLRSLDEGANPDVDQPSESSRFSWLRIGAGVLLVVVLFGGLWWALSASSAQRLPNQSITGLDPRTDRQKLLSQAYAVQFERPDEAAALYGMVLEENPDDVEAMTYGGWTTALAAVRNPDQDSEVTTASLTRAAEMLTKAIELDPSYPDPRCLRGVLFGRFLNQPDLAKPDLDECLALDPPSDMRSLIQGLLDDVEAAGQQASG